MFFVFGVLAAPILSRLLANEWEGYDPARDRRLPNAVMLAVAFGVVIAEGSTDKEEILIGEIDLARMEDVRRNWPFLRDRRIDAYVGIDRRFLDE